MRSEQALERTRGSKVLSIQDYDRIQPIDRGGWAQVDAPLTDTAGLSLRILMIGFSDVILGDTED